MFDFLKWFSANDKADRHTANAKAASAAHCAHSSDRVRGVHRVVDTNLDRVFRRELFKSQKARSEALKD